MDKFNRIMATKKKLLMIEMMKLILNNQETRFNSLKINNKLMVNYIIKILKRPKKMTFFNQPAIIFYIIKN